MSVTQYIGARYVPVFADPAEWDSERSYEPLTIVTHEGNSYTSAQSVPVGIDISNDQFWKLTGNYDAQVEQYRKEVSQFDARITTAGTTANDALELAHTNEGDISILDDQIAGNTDSGLKDSIEGVSATLGKRIDNLDSQMAAETDSKLLDKIDAKRSIDVHEIIIQGYDSNYTAMIVVTDKVGLIDCGTGMVGGVADKMNELGFEKFDYIVFTHMHTDHTPRTDDEIDTLKQFVSADTPIYIQMAPSSAFAQYGSYVNGYESISKLGGKLQVPTDAGAVKFGDTTITMYNSDTANVAAYGAYTELNIFSLVARVDFSGSSFVACGDIYWTAQCNYLNIGNADLVQWPHHGGNVWDSFDFINQFNTSNFLVTPNKTPLNEIKFHYIDKWQRQINQTGIWYPDMKGDLLLSVIDGSVSASGHASMFHGKNPYSPFYNHLDVDAISGTSTYPTNVMKEWSLRDLTNKFTRTNPGTTFDIEFLSYDGYQFAHQILAIFTATKKLNAQSISRVKVTKDVWRGSYGLVFGTNEVSPYRFMFSSTATDNEDKMPTYASFEDVISKCVPADTATAKAKTVVGQLYDYYNNIGRLPMMYINQPTNQPYGSYYLGTQTVAEFNTLPVTITARNTPARSARIRFNAAVGAYPSGYETVVYFPIGMTTATVLYSDHVMNYYLSTSLLEIVQDGTVVYKSSTDTENKVSIIGVE